ncbi:MAG: M50 family metallopeptidase [Actinomycetota bacterium]|nr:M50 family metallopeptidase [Actinomycetota bacterium]
MTTFTDAATIVFWGVLTFSILIVLHEGGHFLAARAFGVKVHEFMIGLPGPAIRLHTKKTVFGITAIPLGGYVRIAGMEPGAEDELLAQALLLAAREGTPGAIDAPALSIALGVDRDRAASLLYTLADWGAVVEDEAIPGRYHSTVEDDGRVTAQELLDRARSETYRGLPTWKRITVLASGVVTNIATALLVFTIVLSIWGYYTPSLTLADISEGYPAESAGMRAGDTITAVDGNLVTQWMEFSETIADTEPGTELAVTYERNGEPTTVDITLVESPDTGGGFLGVAADIKHVELTAPEALLESFKWTGKVFVAIGDFFRPATFERSIKGARSIIGISVEVAEAAKNGPLDYAWWIALLSMVLGVMNTLPIPPLDGGKIVLEIVEKLVGKPLDRRVTLGLSLAGALVLFTFIGYVMYADVMRYFVNA